MQAFGGFAFLFGARDQVWTGTPKGWSLSTLTLLCYPRKMKMRGDYIKKVRVVKFLHSSRVKNLQIFSWTIYFNFSSLSSIFSFIHLYIWVWSEMSFNDISLEPLPFVNTTTFPFQNILCTNHWFCSTKSIFSNKILLIFLYIIPRYAKIRVFCKIYNVTINRKSTSNLKCFFYRSGSIIFHWKRDKTAL